MNATNPQESVRNQETSLTAFNAAEARAAFAARARFIVAISGGRTPWQMLRVLAREDIPRDGLHVVQVDERIAPLEHPGRNVTYSRERMFEHAPLRNERTHPMPVESPDLHASALGTFAFQRDA